MFRLIYHPRLVPERPSKALQSDLPNVTQVSDSRGKAKAKKGQTAEERTLNLKLGTKCKFTSRAKGIH